MKNKLTFIFLTLLFSSTFIYSASKKLPQKELTIQKSDGTSIEVLAEIARNPDDRAKGFMERKKIPEGTGMLFIFEQDQILSFWMKNTPTPLSIAYIESQGRIKDIFDMKPFSLAPILSTSSVRYALEVPQGWYKKNGITIGDTIQLP